MWADSTPRRYYLRGAPQIHQSARLLSTMPGVSDLTAHVIVAEIGVDMTRFASDAHLRSWGWLLSAQR
jgi:transposase